jgi:hypothetical protein
VAAVGLGLACLAAGLPAAVALGADAAERSAADAPFTVSDVQHPDDTVTFETADGRLLVHVGSTRGFGRCTISARDGAWPDRLAIRIDGPRELEAVELLLGGLRVEGSRSRSGNFSVEADRGAEGSVAAAGPWRDGDTLFVVVTKTPGGMVVEFPEGFAAAAAGGSVRLAWVDWLRR